MTSESEFIADLIAQKRLVVIRLREGRDLSGVILANDVQSLVLSSNDRRQRSLLYKAAISVITPVLEE